jgi:hypothetical protein
MAQPRDIKKDTWRIIASHANESQYKTPLLLETAGFLRFFFTFGQKSLYVAWISRFCQGKSITIDTSQWHTAQFVFIQKINTM